MLISPRKVSVKPARMNIVKGRKLDALKDVPDIRDRIYEPTLAPLPPQVPAPTGLTILDQGKDGACTGFALAAAINLLLATNTKLAATERARRVSAHMLYVMARQHDEWPGEIYEGSSLRGALRGFFNCGACLDKLWKTPTLKELSLQSAQDARNTTLGAYFRLRPHLPDYHAALSETGVIFASATVHRGWDNPVKGKITTGQGVSLHAFAIVGYDQEGFWIQNSWGKSWADKGIAHWPYEDWAANIQDAWVLQLAVPAPCAFGLGRARGQGRTGADISRTKRVAPARTDIAGHFVHVDNGNFSKTQPYWSDERDVAATAELMAKTKEYQHFLFYAHGGLNAPDEAAMRTAAMKDVFKENGIYPYSVFYDTGLMKTLKEVILGRADEINTRTGGLLDLTDALIEKAIGSVGTKLWNEMKADARLPFDKNRDGEKALKLFVDQLTARAKAGLPPLQIHLAGHSTGAILIGHLLNALDRVLPAAVHVQSCSLMAPACSIGFFQEHYKPRLGATSKAQTRIDRLKIYCLQDPEEQDDTVTPLYNKSLLYLVSNAFENERKLPILGMENFKKEAGVTLSHFAFADKASTETRAKTHGGFDNDPFTMNDILRELLKKAPKRPFSERDLDF
nr:C1 family peptidase [uncultured Dongia sp.]